MENVLRVREITQRKQNARYMNIEMGEGANAHRGVITPCMIRCLPDGTSDNISFVRDTPHNRSVFLQREGVEIAMYEKDRWVCLDKAWLDKAFAPAEGGIIAQPVEHKTPPKSSEKQININSFEDFLQLHKNTQGKAFQALMASDAEELKLEIVEGIKTNPEDPLLAKSVVELALKC